MGDREEGQIRRYYGCNVSRTWEYRTNKGFTNRQPADNASRASIQGNESA